MIAGDVTINDERATGLLLGANLRRDYVLVEVEDEPTMSPGGIALVPPKDEARQSIGRVLKVGPGAYDAKGRFTPTSLRVGERVAFSRYGHTKIGKLRLFREPSTHYVCEP